MEFDESLCCGCGACTNICPTSAIKWVTTEQGFKEPLIDQKACIDCGLCRKVCAYEMSHVGIEAEPQVYAAVHKREDVVKSSSSGGVFTALSDWILDQGGIIYGVAFDNQYRLRYCRAETQQERDSFKGSKYVQCDGKDIFPAVVEDLKSSRTVMFTGTPCQVSGLKLFLTVKKVPTDNLFLVDNICHGVASPKVWSEYLAFVKEDVLRGHTIKRFSMRSKKVAWQKQELDCETEIGDESAHLNRGASWNKLYHTTFATRNSCFNCRFTSYDRVGDITVADYWNIENAGLAIDYRGGVNLVLVNTEKGERWLRSCKSHLVLDSSDKKACWQIHLESSTPYSDKCAQFWREFATNPRETVRKNAKGFFFNKLIHFITPFLRKLGLYTLAVRVFGALKKG